MPKVTVCRGRDIEEQRKWCGRKLNTGLMVDTGLIKEMLGGGTDKLILSIRDNTMVKCLRSKRNVILTGEHKDLEQLERIDEVLTAQGEIDGAKYTWKVKDF